MDKKIEKRLEKLVQNVKLLINTVTSETSNIKDLAFLKQLGIDSFGFYSLPFLYTTENIKGYMNDLDIEGKDVLTVVGSGDHIFDAALKGAKKIDAFDISGYAILFYYLKEAAVKSLEYDEYVKFFLNAETKFSTELYAKIRPNLNQTALTFWDELYKEFARNPQIMKLLFRHVIADSVENPEFLAERLGAISLCWNREEYYKLR